MATTTNYGWTTPDDTALVKDGAAAIRTLGSSVDTTTKALNPSTTLGDIEYRSSTSNTNTRLAIGSTGNVLTVAGGVPTWAAPAGGGKVLQVVEGTTSTTTSIATSTYTDTGITATITPTLATSRIMIVVSAPISLIRDSTTNFAGMRLLKGATTLTTNDYAVGFTNTGSTSFEVNHTLSFSYIDSPNTTSATTYKIQGNTLFTANTGTVRYNYANTRSSIILLEIGA
jgi:hypothetical protein